jgi:hypothetical protein
MPREGALITLNPNTKTETMSRTVKLDTETHEGMEIIIESDPHAENPRKFSTLGTLFVPGNDHLSDGEMRASQTAKNFGGDAIKKEFMHKLVRRAYSDEEMIAREERHNVDLEAPTSYATFLSDLRDERELEILEEMARERYEILPVYKYEHSGVALSTTPFRSSWDSGQIGWVFVSHEQIKENYAEEEIDEDLRETARELMKSNIDVFSTWVAGEAVGFKVEDPEEGITVDSCWGFYDREYAMERAKSSAERIAE